MTQNPLVEQAKQGNVNAIASLMNRLLKSQGMLANVERDGDRLEILIESDLRSLDDEVRIPKRQILVGMIKKWFITLEVQTVSVIKISWQQTGFDEPAWTEEVSLTNQVGQVEQLDTFDQKEANISENSGVDQRQRRLKIMPLPVFPPKSMRNDEQNNPTRDRHDSDSQSFAEEADLDEMFGTPLSIPDISLIPERKPEPANIQSSPDILLLSDVPAIPNDDEQSDFQAENPISFNNFSWQSLLKTPNLTFQFIQYLVVCAMIIFTLRGIHTAFGSSKVPKAASVKTQSVLL